MAVNRQTAWTDDTEVTVSSTAVRVNGVEIQKHPSMGTGEIWVGLWNNADPDLAANTESPDIILYVPGPTTDRKFSLKIPLGGVVFGTALSWFIFETTNDFGDAVTGNNIPVARVFYAPLA